MLTFIQELIGRKLIKGWVFEVNYRDHECVISQLGNTMKVYWRTFESMHSKGYLEQSAKHPLGLYFTASKKLKAEISSKDPIDFQL